MKQRPTLETERLLLRPFEPSDAKDVQHLAGDRAIADTTLNIPHPYEDGMAEEWISTHQPKFEAGGLVNFAIVLRGTGELIGAMGRELPPHRPAGGWRVHSLRRRTLARHARPVRGGA